MSTCISIVTHNRAEELRRTLPQLRTLDPRPDELRVTLDRCTDESAAVVAELYPEAIVTHADKGGSIPNRDDILRATTCDYVLNLDDDSYPTAAHILADCSRYMEAHPDCAVMSFLQISDEFPDKIPDPDGPVQDTASYANCGAFLRRTAYLETQGYSRFFMHAYEEPDLALQLMDRGYRVTESPRWIVRHHYSPVERNEQRTHRLHARNGLWSMLMRAPASLLLLECARMILSQTAYAQRRGWLLKEPLWWLKALQGLPRAWSARAPVSHTSFAQWRRLLHHPQIRQDD